MSDRMGSRFPLTSVRSRSRRFGWRLPHFSGRGGTSMQTREQAAARREYAYDLFRKAGIFVTDAEKERIETADFGLDEFERTGLGVLVYVNTERCCAKELAMWPRQTCPEHRHPPVGSDPGKEET